MWHTVDVEDRGPPKGCVVATDTRLRHAHRSDCGVFVVEKRGVVGVYALLAAVAAEDARVAHVVAIARRSERRLTASVARGGRVARGREGDEQRHGGSAAVPGVPRGAHVVQVSLGCVTRGVYGALLPCRWLQGAYAGVSPSCT